MLSIARHMDEHDIAQEIRLERGVHQGSFLLVEGKTDIKRFTKFIDEKNCSLVNCYGRRKAIGAIEILNNMRFNRAVAAVDADFDRVNDTLLNYKNVIYSENHDFDIDWAQPSVVKRYLFEVGDIEKCRLYGSIKVIIEKIMEALRPVSTTRLLNRRRQISYKTSHIDISKCFDNFSVNIDKYADMILEAETDLDAKKTDLLSKIVQFSNNRHDVRQITNGHDFYCALGASLREDLGSRRFQQTWGSEIEAHIRLTFSDNDFKQSFVYHSIKQWELNNFPYVVLDKSFK